MQYVEKSLFGTIEHGQTGITFTDDFITNDSIIDVYFEDDDIIPTETTQSGNTVTVTIEETTTDVDVCIHITNEDTIDYYNEIDTLSSRVDNIDDVITSLQETKQDTLPNPINNYYLHANANTGSLEWAEVQSSSGITYSTSEFDTGKTWLDGKKIYCKVFTGTTLVPGNNITSVSDLQIDTPINITMNVKVTLSGNTRWRPVPFAYWNNGSDSTWYGGVFYNYPEDSINAQLGSSLINGVNNWFIIVEYTKRS